MASAHRIGRDQVIWAFGPGLEPVLEVDPGEAACPSPFAYWGR